MSNLKSKTEYRIVVRFNMLLVFIVTGMLVLLSAVSYVRAKHSLESDLQLQIQTALDRLGFSLPTAVWNFDSDQIDKTLRSEMSMSAVQAIVVTQGPKLVGGVMRGADGALARVEDLKKVTSEASQGAELAIVENNKRDGVGQVTVHFTREGIRATLRDQLLMLVLVVWRILALVVLRPLSQTCDGLKNVASGEADLTRRMPNSDSKEFMNVVVKFNTFVERLEKVIIDVQANALSCAQSIQQIERGNNDFSERTEAQVHSLEQISAAIKELTSAVAQNADNAGHADSLTHGARELVANGSTMMSEVVDTMGGLNQRSQQMADIINVIDSIAFQTNILALNAAVEAARAGDQGRGFAVVAAEVRGLARRSAQAAKEIKILITDSVQRVESGSKQVEQAGQIMNNIVSAIQEVSGTVRSITDASREQQSGIEQIRQAIAEMDQNTHFNAELVQQNSRAVSEVRSQMEALVGAVGVFKVGPAAADMTQQAAYSEPAALPSAQAKALDGKTRKRHALLQ